MLAVKTLSQFRWRVIGRWRGAVGLVSFILVLQLEGDVKEPVTLFEKSRGRRPRCHGLSDLCRHRSGWARCDQNMDWTGCKSSPLHADVRSHLFGSSAIEERWHNIFFFLTIATNGLEILSLCRQRKNEQQRKIFISYSGVTKSNNLRTETSKSVAIIHYFITISILCLKNGVIMSPRNKFLSPLPVFAFFGHTLT